MVNEVIKKLSISNKTIVRINNNKIELIEGDLEKKPWIVIDENENLNILEDANNYMEFHKILNKLTKEVFDLKLEKAILTKTPKDYDDVKAVVIKEMQESGNKDIEKTLDSIQQRHPNLFLNFSFDDIDSLIQGIK